MLFKINKLENIIGSTVKGLEFGTFIFSHQNLNDNISYISYVILN